MFISGSRLPLSLDPLIAEAKQRARRRRLLLAATAAALVLGGTIGEGFSLSGPTHGSAAPISPARAQLPPLSGLAARKPFCGNRHTTCRSTDGKWSIVYTNPSSTAHPTEYCVLTVTNTATGRKNRIRRLHDACNHGLWIGRTYIVQGTDRVLSLDPPSLRVKTIAHFGTYVVSPDERWIAGEAELRRGPGSARLIAVLSPALHTCRVATQARDRGQYVAVDTSPWQYGFLSADAGLIKEPRVTWRTIVQQGKKIRVVSGPGTGFTRNSRSLIVAKWRYASKPHVHAVRMRLVKLGLAALHIRCPAGVS